MKKSVPISSPNEREKNVNPSEYRWKSRTKVVKWIETRLYLVFCRLVGSNAEDPLSSTDKTNITEPLKIRCRYCHLHVFVRCVMLRCTRSRDLFVNYTTCKSGVRPAALSFPSLYGPRSGCQLVSLRVRTRSSIDGHWQPRDTTTCTTPDFPTGTAIDFYSAGICMVGSNEELPVRRSKKKKKRRKKKHQTRINICAFHTSSARLSRSYFHFSTSFSHVVHRTAIPIWNRFFFHDTYFYRKYKIK